MHMLRVHYGQKPPTAPSLRHDDIDVSLWASWSGCDKRECEMRDRIVRAPSFAGRSCACHRHHFLTHPVPSLIHLAERPRLLRRACAGITCCSSSMQRDLGFLTPLRSVKLQEVEPRCNLAYHASVHEPPLLLTVCRTNSNARDALSCR